MKEWGDTVNERPLQGAASPTARTCVSGSEEESLPYPLTELLLPLLTTLSSAHLKVLVPEGTYQPT